MAPCTDQAVIPAEPAEGAPTGEAGPIMPAVQERRDLTLPLDERGIQVTGELAFASDDTQPLTIGA